MPEIDLADLTKGTGTMLTGHERGLAARGHFKMDRFDAGADAEHIIIKSPANLDTVTPSFVQGFWAASLRALGENNLRSKYDTSKLPKVLQEDFETGLQRLLLHRRAHAED